MIYNIFPLKCPYCEKDFPIWNICGEPYALENKAVNDYKCSFCNAEINVKCSMPIEGLSPKKAVDNEIIKEIEPIEKSVKEVQQEYIAYESVKKEEPIAEKPIIRIPVLCPKCRCELTVPENREAALCRNCRTPFAVEDARTLYLTKGEVPIINNEDEGIQPVDTVETPQQENFVIRPKKEQTSVSDSTNKIKEPINRDKDNTHLNNREKRVNNNKQNNKANNRVNQKQKPDGMALGCVIFGMLGILFPNSLAVLIGLVGLILGIVGLVKKKTPKWMCVTGLILGILAIISAPVKSDTEGTTSTPTVSESQNVETESPVVEEAPQEVNETEETPQEETEVDNISTQTEVKLSKDEVMALCQDLDYKELERNPDDFVGQYFAVTVKVFMVQEGGLLNDFKRAYRTYTKNEYGWMGDSVLLKDNRDPAEPGYVKILEDDYVRVYARFDALADMKNVLNGAKSQQVCLEVLYADIISEEEADMVTTDGQVIQVSDADFDVTEYINEGMFATDDYIVITNNSDYAVEVNGTATALDASGAAIGADDATLNVIGPKETSIFNFYFSDVKDVDNVDYKLSYRASRYTNIVGDLSLDYSVSQKNVIINVTNNGSKTGEFVEATVLFFDSNNNLVYADTTYITDEDSEIKPGATITKQASSFEDFDHVEVYLEGRVK